MCKRPAWPLPDLSGFVEQARSTQAHRFCTTDWIVDGGATLLNLPPTFTSHTIYSRVRSDETPETRLIESKVYAAVTDPVSMKCLTGL
jgi:hypothetical protein